MNIYPRAHWLLSLGLLVAIGGFVPTYWSQHAGTVDLVVHVHALTATAWFVILIVQPWLVSTGGVGIHRTVGLVALADALALVVTAGAIIPRSLHLPVANAELPYIFIYWDIVTTSVFAVLVILAIAHRHNVQLHARCMVGSVFVPLLPALARGLFFDGVIDDFVSAMYVGNLLLVGAIALLVRDDALRGRRDAPYPALLAVFLVLGATMEWVGGAAWWKALVDAAVVPLVWLPLVGSGALAAGLALHRQELRTTAL